LRNEELGHGNLEDLGIQQQADCLTKEESRDAAVGSAAPPSTTGLPTACGNLQGGLKIDDHVTETANKAKRFFHAFSRLGGRG
jgi:hypothetical protein